MKFKEKIKKFWKKHWKKIVIVSGGATLTGAAIYYGMHKTEPTVEIETEAVKDKTLDELTAWNKDWDEMAMEFEHLTHQPLGSFEHGYTEEEGYIDPLDGNCFIIAGRNSYYNDDPDSLEFYVLDKEGYFHRMPEDVYSA